MTRISENNKSKIVALGDKMRERQVPQIRTALDYYRCRTRPNLLRLLRTVQEVEGLGPIMERLEACSGRKRCGLYGCPNCGARLRRKESMDALKQIVAKAGGTPDRSGMSFVTVRGSAVALMPTATLEAMDRLKARIKDLQRTLRLRQTGWIGWFDVSLTGVVHWHGVILHTGMPRKYLEQRIKAHFRKHKAVKVSAWQAEGSDLQNLLAVLEYSIPADRHVKILKDHPKHGRLTAQFIAQRLVCLQSMTGAGTRGIRLKLNMLSARRWKAGVMFDRETCQTIVVPEMEELILGVRRQGRRNRTEWFRRRIAGPSGTFGFHQEEGVRVPGTE